MGLNNTPSSERVHIGIFGRRNSGKSSLINAITGQDLAIVSEVLGTTTDPVYKSMELLPLGPVVIIDTPGLDDVGELGRQRVEKGYQVLGKTDIAVLVVDSTEGRNGFDEEILAVLKEKKIPCITVYNKCDLGGKRVQPEDESPSISVSAETKANINELKEMLARMVPQCTGESKLVADLILPGDVVLLIVPIDSAAPKGRLILPQQQVIRDILEAGACATVIRENGIDRTLRSLSVRPRLVVTDSQVFEKVKKEIPEDIPLTSFSILFARYKGSLSEAIRAAKILDSLSDGDKVLISEGCTHHRQCDDIGTVKLPKWILKHSGKALEFEFTSGTGFRRDLSEYRLVVHCGGCMLNEREIQSRLSYAKAEGIPMTNYGIAIAYMNGILARSISPFPEFDGLLE
jgi:[FeFe] hydrogenase H-cluster maturation GTPase HydF